MTDHVFDGVMPALMTPCRSDGTTDVEALVASVGHSRIPVFGNGKISSLFLTFRPSNHAGGASTVILSRVTLNRCFLRDGVLIALASIYLHCCELHVDIFPRVHSSDTGETLLVNRLDV